MFFKGMLQVCFSSAYVELVLWKKHTHTHTKYHLNYTRSLPPPNPIHKDLLSHPPLSMSLLYPFSPFLYYSLCLSLVFLFQFWEFSLSAPRRQFYLSPSIFFAILQNNTLTQKFLLILTTSTQTSNSCSPSSSLLFSSFLPSSARMVQSAPTCSFWSRTF